MQTETTTWTDARGFTHSVITVREAGETPEAFAARHNAAVNALAAIFPPKVP